MKFNWFYGVLYGVIFEFYKKFWTDLAEMCPNALKTTRRSWKIDKKNFGRKCDFSKKSGLAKVRSRLCRGIFRFFLHEELDLVEG